ncbi:MAG: transposase [Patescibacteria group bacterium]|nr:transposase [Patescibacteria group bacterium]
MFNRSVGKEEIFANKKALNKALDIIDYYRFSQELRYSKFKTLPRNLREEYAINIKGKTPLVEIYAFVLMPNHYHFLLKQLQDSGILRFVSNFQNSFAKNHNLINGRHGTLFENSFKARWVETDEEFLHLSRYIHLNPVTSFLIEFKYLASYPWSSLSWYVDVNINRFVFSDFLLGMFKSKEKYFEFVADQVDYQRNLGLIKKMIIE